MHVRSRPSPEFEPTKSPDDRHRMGRALFLTCTSLFLFGGLWITACFGIAAYDAELESRDVILSSSSVTQPPVSVRVLTPHTWAWTTPAGGMKEGAPVVIVTHGFAANKETMQTLAMTLARSGMRVYLFDLPGHGESPDSFPRADGAATPRFLTALSHVYSVVRRENGPTAHIAFVGHSVGSGLVAQFALAHPEIAATVLLSPAFVPPLRGARPHNLLVLVGEYDVGVSRQSAQDIWTQVSSQPAPVLTPNLVLSRGDAARGSAQRLVVLPGANHISILYDARCLTETLQWLQQSFLSGPSPVPSDAGQTRVLWTVLGLFAAVGLLFPLTSIATAGVAHLFGQPQPRQRGEARAGHGRESLAIVAILFASALVSAVMWTPLKPPALVPLQLGDYVSGFFCATGLLAGCGIWLTDRAKQSKTHSVASWAGRATFRDVFTRTRCGSIILAVSMASATYIFLGLFSSATWEGLRLTPRRLVPFCMIVPLLLPYFLVQEYGVRRFQARWGLLRAFAFGLIPSMSLLAGLVVAIELNITVLGFGVAGVMEQKTGVRILRDFFGGFFLDSCENGDFWLQIIAYEPRNIGTRVVDCCENSHSRSNPLCIPRKNMAVFA